MIAKIQFIIYGVGDVRGGKVLVARAEVFTLDDQSFRVELKRSVMLSHSIVRATDVAVTLSNIQATRSQQLSCQFTNLVVSATQKVNEKRQPHMCLEFEKYYGTSLWPDPFSPLASA
jgi:hypothetical protein